MISRRVGGYDGCDGDPQEKIQELRREIFPQQIPKMRIIVSSAIMMRIVIHRISQYGDRERERNSIITIWGKMKKKGEEEKKRRIYQMLLSEEYEQPLTP